MAGLNNKSSTTLELASGLLFSLLVIFSLFAAHPEAEDDKTAVATINGEKITSKRLSERAQIYRILLALKSVPEFAEFLMDTEEGKKVLDTYRSYVLEKLIEEELILQQAELRGIKIKDQEIEERLTKIIAETDEVSNKEELLEELKKDQRTLHDLKEEIYRKLVREKLKRRIVKDVSVNQKEIEEFYEKNRDSFRDADGNIPPLSEVRDQIRERIKKNKRDSLWQKWLEEKKSEARIIRKLGADTAN